MQNVLLSPIPMEQLRSEISETVKRELQAILTVIQAPKEETEYLTRKQAATVLNISLPTLNEWTKTGLVQGYRIASRVRYKRSELEASLAKIKTRKAA